MSNQKPDLNDPMTTNAEIGRWLRTQTVEERIEFLIDAFHRNPAAGFDIGRRSNLGRIDLIKVIEGSIDTADASSIQFWLKLFCERAGLKQTAKLIAQFRKKGREDLVQLAGYWFGFLPGAQNKEKLSLLGIELQKLKPTTKNKPTNNTNT